MRVEQLATDLKEILPFQHITPNTDSIRPISGYTVHVQHSKERSARWIGSVDRRDHVMAAVRESATL